MNRKILTRLQKLKKMKYDLSNIDISSNEESNSIKMKINEIELEIAQLEKYEEKSTSNVVQDLYFG